MMASCQLLSSACAWSTCYRCKAEGYTGYRTEVDIAARETSLRIRLEVERPQTSMTFKTHPAGATLFVDDKKMEETPVRIPDIKPGRRRLRLEKDGYTTYEGQSILSRVNPN